MSSVLNFVIYFMLGAGFGILAVFGWALRSVRKTKQSRREVQEKYLHFDSALEADTVLEMMRELISEYGYVCVADLKELTGERCDYTDHRYGWTDLSYAKVMRMRCGWELLIPKPERLIHTQYGEDTDESVTNDDVVSENAWTNTPVPINFDENNGIQLKFELDEGESK